MPSCADYAAEKWFDVTKETLCTCMTRPVYEILVLIASMSSEGSDESVHMHRLARAFAARIDEVWM